VYEKGAAEKVVELVKKDGKTYVVINDYEKVRDLFGRLLAEIQRIKSTGDYAGAHDLVEAYAVKVDPALHAEVLERYKKLNLAPYKGFVNPHVSEHIVVVHNGIIENHEELREELKVLGDMLELGELSREAHEELGRLAAESDLYCLVTYGENAKRTAVVAAAKGQKTLHANNYREAADALLNRIEPGDALLVKASRGMALEKVLEIFYAEQKDAEE
jgi:hypothetical protein